MAADESLAFLVDMMVEEQIVLSERFQVTDLLGEGRFSSVRKAKATSSDLEVALKGIALEELDDEEALQMLEAEVAALRRAAQCEELRRHVVQLHQVVRTSDTIYLVMGLVPGVELFVLVERHDGLPEPIVRTLMAQLMLALDRLHHLGVAHRDVKPENMMVSGLHSAATTHLLEYVLAMSELSRLRAEAHAFMHHVAGEATGRLHATAVHRSRGG